MSCARWSSEANFEEARAHLGLETHRQWSDLAIERTTPLLFGHALAPDGHLPSKQTVWYHEETVTFTDVFAIVRRPLWSPFRFPTSPRTLMSFERFVLRLLSSLLRFVTEQ